ncbi:hypothetical protein NCCP133_39590 [Cytobacillus sp. NCCP-133]|nr:hypothetical protein NCCP133_39590 [Cytobacillus sp. NCCP-133]
MDLLGFTCGGSHFSLFPKDIDVTIIIMVQKKHNYLRKQIIQTRIRSTLLE